MNKTYSTVITRKGAGEGGIDKDRAGKKKSERQND